MKELQEHKDLIIKTTIVFGVIIVGLVALNVVEEVFDILFDFIDF